MVKPYAAFYGKSGERKPDQFFIDPSKSHFGGELIAQGQVHKQYTVMGMLADTNELVMSHIFEEDGTTKITDGSEMPYAIIVEDVDTTDAADSIAVLLEGVVNQDDLIIGRGHTIESVKRALRKTSIYLERLG